MVNNVVNKMHVKKVKHRLYMRSRVTRSAVFNTEQGHLITRSSRPPPSRMCVIEWERVSARTVMQGQRHLLIKLIAEIVERLMGIEGVNVVYVVGWGRVEI
ncbi:hypothetical protein J6590_037642 [Homalodisca vitripennis]|nr:hypothetical protein J6590_037642 [Homalodisca vitripennis]